MHKILIVDDDRRINDLLEDILTMEGYNVIKAYDGEEAIEVLDNIDDIDLVLLDVMMPKIDGWDLLAYIKSRFDIKVLMLTALGDEEDEINQYDLSLFVQEEDGRYRKYEETHLQRAYEQERVEELLKESGLELLHVYDAFTKELPAEDSQRIYYVCRRPAR